MVSLANTLYELRKQQIIAKTIEECDVDLIIQPMIKNIDAMKIEEGEILKQINELVEELRVMAYYDVY
jgi:hypothetical protein